MIVADTNLLAYLLIEGEQTDSARRALAKDPEWYVPKLWIHEYRNVLVNYMRHGRMNLDSAQDRFRVAETIIAGRIMEVATASILACAARYAISAYDAEYVCLAAELSVPLVTADRKLVRQVPGVAILPETFAP